MQRGVGRAGCCLRVRFLPGAEAGERLRGAARGRRRLGLLGVGLAGRLHVLVDVEEAVGVVPGPMAEGDAVRPGAQAGRCSSAPASRARAPARSVHSYRAVGVRGPSPVRLTRAGFSYRPQGSHTDLMGPQERARSARKGVTASAELVAQRIAERVIDIVVQAVDINALLQLVDLNALLERVDVNAPLKQMDLNSLLKQVDLNEPLRQVDLNALLARVDVNAPLKQMDVNAPLKQMDLNSLLKQVDLNEILEQVDVSALLDRVNINDVVARIDMERLVEQTDLGAIIARLTGGIATEALDTVRSGAVGLDRRIERWVTRLLRRKDRGPLAPRALLGPEARP